MADKRLQSLDVLRGLTVAGMIMVNNGYRDSFEMLRHADWNGLSLSDFVFPFFLFIMGVSIFLKFSRNNFRLSAPISAQIIKRTLLLILIGIAINWLEMACNGGAFNFSELRFWAVLQRIAICYFLASFITIFFNHKLVLPIAVLLLVIYAIIITVGNGYSTDKNLNILYLTDKNIFGDSHLYHKSAVDPEGLLGTISSLSNVLFGFYCGMKIRKSSNILSKTVSCFILGSLLVISGFVMNFFLPVNKHIWSPSFALITSGACSLVLGICIKWIDCDKYQGWLSYFFKVFGSNALLLYITSEVMAIVFGAIGINKALFSFWNGVIVIPPLASLCYALTYVLMNFIIGYPLYKKHVFIKL